MRKMNFFPHLSHSFSRKCRKSSVFKGLGELGRRRERGRLYWQQFCGGWHIEKRKDPGSKEKEALLSQGLHFFRKFPMQSLKITSLCGFHICNDQIIPKFQNFNRRTLLSGFTIPSPVFSCHTRHSPPLKISKLFNTGIAPYFPIR